MKKSFTMIEIIFVILVIGILSTAIISKRDSGKLQKAAAQLAAHIRYTQHLAIIDDKFNVNDDIWFKRRWQIIFSKSAYTANKPAYTIFSDTSGSASGNPDKQEIATNPLDTTRRLSGGHSGTMHIVKDAAKVTKEMNLGMTYGIDSYRLSGGCSGARIAFDHLGRPIKGNLSSMKGAYLASTKRIIVRTCFITLKSNEQSIRIAIEPESGYVYIL